MGQDGWLVSFSDLNGAWSGVYIYPNGSSTPFVATLVQTGGTVTGLTEEPDNHRVFKTSPVYAALAGEISGSMLTFVKTYENLDRQRRPITYAAGGQRRLFQD